MIAIYVRATWRMFVTHKPSIWELFSALMRFAPMATTCSHEFRYSWRMQEPMMQIASPMGNLTRLKCAVKTAFCREPISVDVESSTTIRWRITAFFLNCSIFLGVGGSQQNPYTIVFVCSLRIFWCTVSLPFLHMRSDDPVKHSD